MGEWAEEVVWAHARFHLFLFIFLFLNLFSSLFLEFKFELGYEIHPCSKIVLIQILMEGKYTLIYIFIVVNIYLASKMR